MKRNSFECMKDLREHKGSKFSTTPFIERLKKEQLKASEWWGGLNEEQFYALFGLLIRDINLGLTTKQKQSIPDVIEVVERGWGKVAIRRPFSEFLQPKRVLPTVTIEGKEYQYPTNIAEDVLECDITEATRELSKFGIPKVFKDFAENGKIFIEEFEEKWRQKICKVVKKHTDWESWTIEVFVGIVAVALFPEEPISSLIFAAVAVKIHRIGIKKYCEGATVVNPEG